MQGYCWLDEPLSKPSFCSLFKVAAKSVGPVD